MFEEVTVLTHSSIKIAGKKKIYFDPFEVQEESHDADLVFVTHEHHDHYSPEDIGKVANPDTWIIMPESMRAYKEKMGNLKCKFVCPGGITEAKGIMINAVPAYNRLKPFHTRGKGYVDLWRLFLSAGNIRWTVKKQQSL